MKGLQKGARGRGKKDGGGGAVRGAKGGGIYISIKFSTKQLEH